MRWYEVTVTGQDSHAGTTPMPRRHDALLAAAWFCGAFAGLILLAVAGRALGLARRRGAVEVATPAASVRVS